MVWAENWFFVKIFPLMDLIFGLFDEPHFGACEILNGLLRAQQKNIKQLAQGSPHNTNQIPKNTTIWPPPLSKNKKGK